MIADPDKKTLIIVESPTKARTITRFLPDTCTVMASMGHVADLATAPKTGIYGVDVDNGYELEYVVDPSKASMIKEMKAKLKGSEQLVLATDEDREGESISWHLLNILKPKCPVYRMVFHEITKSAIINAFSNCRELDMNLVHAQEARRAVDRLQGYGISPLLSHKLGGKYSAGRVQSPGLKLVVEREKERRRYRSSEYTSLETKMEADGMKFSSTLVRIGEDKVASSSSYDRETGNLKSGYIALSSEKAEEIASEVKGKSAAVFSVTNREKIQSPSKPFTTSTLQQDASRKMKKSVKEIMAIAQHLYENGFITYMRTDSPTLSSECINAARVQVESLFGSDYLSPRPRNYKATDENAQEAHEAIRPAGDHFRRPEETGLSGDNLRLYTIIWRRTLATQMKDAEKSTTSVLFALDDYMFSSSGTTIKFPGFLKLYQVATDDDEKEEEEGILPSLEAGNSVDIVSAECKAHTTEPPARYNEASLVQKLESEGIGRPSTYAAIISTLLDRKYVTRVNQQLVPTFTGFFVDSFLESTFPVYVGYDFTSRMEKGLDKIAGGEETKTAFLDRFWKGSDDFHGLHADLVSVSNTVRTSEVKSLSIPGLSYVFKHDDSDVHYSIRISKFGPYLASDYFDKEAGKNKMVSLDQTKYFPGTFTDNDAASILFPDNSAVEIVDGIYQMEGRYGIYYKRQSDGKIVNGLRDKKKALSPELIKLAFELPKSLGADEDEEEVILVFGPYGFYANYKGKNYPVANPESVSMEDIIKVSNGGKQDFPVIKDFGLYEDNPLQLLDGRYGPFIRWGKKNCALSKELKENPSAITEEDARKIASEAPEKKAKRRTARRTRKA